MTGRWQVAVGLTGDSFKQDSGCQGHALALWGLASLSLGVVMEPALLICLPTPRESGQGA